MTRFTRGLAGALVTAVASVTQTGCANTFETIGGTAAGVGAATFMLGAGLSTTRDCDYSRTPCYRGATQIHGDVTVYAQRDVPLMVTGAVLASAGLAVYVVGLTRRPSHASPPTAAPPSAHAPAPGDDPETTLLR